MIRSVQQQIEECAGWTSESGSRKSLGTSRTGTNNVISECFLRQNLSTFDVVFSRFDTAILEMP